VGILLLKAREFIRLVNLVARKRARHFRELSYLNSSSLLLAQGHRKSSLVCLDHCGLDLVSFDCVVATVRSSSVQLKLGLIVRSDPEVWTENRSERLCGSSRISK